MNNSEFKEVNFVEYCRTCKHSDKEDFKDPCNECLLTGMREGTEVPEYWEAKKK